MTKKIYNKHYKDTLFRWIFGRLDEDSKRWRLELYNALNNSDYKNPDELEVTTIENVIYLTMKNDPVRTTEHLQPEHAATRLFVFFPAI
ncbi:MAG: hypothetical protein K5786_06010 [Treponema sp.]|nr:hypothetical protein [Treponema sp.]